MLGEVDTSGLARGAGSFAKALISNEVRLETVQHDAHLLGSFESDTLIRWMVLLNFGPDAPIPKSIYDASDAADRSQRMQGITKALNDGVAVPLGYYRMTMRVPAPLDREPVVERSPARQDTSPEFQANPPLASLASLSSLPSLLLSQEADAPGTLVEARDNQLQAVAAHFAPVLTGYFAAHLDRLLALLEHEETTAPLDQLVAGNAATAVEAITASQIHAGGLALLHAREDLGALRLASPDDWQPARTPAAAIAFWAAYLGLSHDFFLTLSSAASRTAAASVALAEGPLLTDLHEVLQRAHAAGLTPTALQSTLRQTYEAHGLLPDNSHHANLVLANNVQQTAHAVRYLQTVGNPAAARLIPYLVWWTVGDDRVRQRPQHNHAVMHNRVFAIDHPIWKTWWPPAGHNCRCGIGTISLDEARLLGYVGSEPTGPWPTAPGTGGPALPDPGFQGAPDLDLAAEDLTAQTRRIYRDALTQGGDLLAAVTRLFAALGLLPEVP
jgi:hypothetical protein